MIAWDCHRWSALPDAGGVFDQDAQLMHRMAILSNIYNTVYRLYNLKGHQVHNLTNSEMKIIRFLQETQIIYEV